MKRYYFAWIGTRSVPVTRDGIIKSVVAPGLHAAKWALVYGANARQARAYFIEGNVSKWFTSADEKKESLF